MLDTLLKIGEWQSQGKSEWDRFLEFPKVERKDKNGNPVQNFTLPIILDLDTRDVIIDQENLREYNEKDVRMALGNKMKGSNSKAICSSGISKRLGRIFQSFFGKDGSMADSGNLIEAIENEKPSLLDDHLKRLLTELLLLKEVFIERTTDPDKKTINIKTINERFGLSRNEKIVFLETYIKSVDFGYHEPILFSEISNYRTFLEYSYFGDREDEKPKKAKQKLCYASGKINEDVKELNLTTRYSLNKMFVTETKNYASGFDKKKFSINYQVSVENQKKLDYASSYLLNQGYKIRIANLDHVIVPQFMQNSKVDLEMALEGMHKKSDLLFNINSLDEFAKNVNLELDDEVFWINFIAFESDGNFFKSTEIIKDVSSFHISKLLKAFNDVNWEFRETSFVDWDKVMTEYDYDSKERVPRNLNFNSVFKVIPLRKDKEKKNKALELFKTILENRKVNIEILYDYFVELILCHYYRRYGSYTNVQQSSNDYFDFAVRDSVFKYHAFIQFLKKLNLIDMEDSQTNPIQGKLENKYDQAIQEFFTKMSLNTDQKAMFYLGRMLNTVEYIQKGKTKTVIQKVNFNGMDKENIQRLRISLIEKAKQYNAMGKVIFTDNEFGKHFNFNAWNLNPQEAVFFLLTGYSFGVGAQDAEEITEKGTL
ncbi:TM1802 family CRISPR-associated protein [Zunongwangia sp. F363]|uniref:TM1802 family CRISPR-associated protein n=1 Tax=Autumnicola tepida TaxID=3075595 RepID=A0ABU3CD12_9FLAO|nr:TM1802 family CRISPR-associated protein [Zunongwangia sp. F363]MDT0644219.1 TM1802 family CRISPR-associated protein [Zunongwangia sp. F363]